MVLVSETLPTILSNLGKQISIFNLVFNFQTLPTILPNLGKQFSNSFPKSICCLTHKTLFRRLDIGHFVLFELFCRQPGLQIPVFIARKTINPGSLENSPHFSSMGHRFLQYMFTFLQLLYIFTFCLFKNEKKLSLCCTFSTGGSHQPPSDCFSHRLFLSFCFLNWPQS